MIGAVLAAAALLTGCNNTVPGTPETSSTEFTEPTVPTPRPTRSTPPTTTPLSPEPSTPTAAPPGAELPAQNGTVFVETKSGKAQCQVTEDRAGCQVTSFENPPEVDGGPANGVSVTADGKVTWVLGNIGLGPYVAMDYRTYSAVGWTIDATEAGTRFTNDATGHGMFVSIEKVDTF